MERGNSITLWLHDFKIAIVKKEYEHIDALLDRLPHFDTLEQMYEAQALITEAQTLFEKQRHELLESMKKNRKTKKYLQST